MGEQHTRTLASGPGWRADCVVCTAGPKDRPFEEQHDDFCVAAVAAGTFQYRSARGRTVLAPGSVLLGNLGARFECRHDTGQGDLCIAFHFDPDAVESTLGLRGFAKARLPPSTSLIPLLADLEVAVSGRSSPELEEAGWRLLSAAVSDDEPADRPLPTKREERIAAAVVGRIEHESGAELALSALAEGVALSPYALLRIFRRVVGMTPYQYVLRTRLQRAAVAVGSTALPIARIAFEAGFGDLSTFNHRFRRVMGASPVAYRAATGRR